MKYLLTIDFDIVMSPNIWNYDNEVYLVGDGHGVEFLEKDHPEIASTIADLKKYQKLTEWIIFLCKNGYKNRIHFIDEHKDVLKYVDKNEIWFLENIDSHMDTISGDFKEGDEPDILNNGNWVYYFFKDYGLQEYDYINGDNQINKYKMEIPTPYFKNYDIYVQSFDTYNFDKNRIPDVVVLCASYPWVTTQFWPLFQVWKDIVNNF